MTRDLGFLTREPLVAFVALGTLLWAVSFDSRSGGGVETVHVKAETLRALVKKREDLLGRSLTPREVRTIVDERVDEEILLREAYRRRFHQSDARVRTRLLTVMRSTLDEPVAEPSVAELQAYYRDQAERFRSPPAVTLEQVGFSWGSRAMPQDTAAFLEEVKRHPDPASLGESALFGAAPVRLSRSDLVLRYGPEFADEVLALPLAEWHGPLRSRAGIHYVRVTQRHEPEIAPFEKVEASIRQEWILEKRRALEEKKIDKLRETYRVELPAEFAPGTGET